MKKLLVSVMASICLVYSSVFGLAACGGAGEHPHLWDGGEITVQPSCSEEGEKTFKCTVDGCQETKTESVSKLPHSWDGGKVTKQPACNETGVKTFTCTECKTTYEEPINKIAHTYDGGVLTVIPTLSSKGEIKYTCKECGESVKESVAPRADFGEQFYTSLANQNAWAYGYAKNYDNGTGAFEFARITETDEEQPEVWKAEGVEIKSDWIFCENNAAIAYTVSGDAQINVEVSFIGDEEQTRVSARLVILDSEEAVKGGATVIGGEEKNWQFTNGEEISLTDGDGVYLVFFNEGDGKPSGKLNLRLTAACEHVWDEGETTKTASCTEKGEITYNCTKCGEKKTEDIPMTPHDFTGDLVEVDNDTHTRKCKDCEAKDLANAVPHNIEEGKIIEPPTNENNGSIEIHCPDCGFTGTRVIPALNHRQSETFDKNETHHWYICDEHKDPSCGEKFVVEPHEFIEDAAQSRPATCQEEGLKVSVCECGMTKKENIPKLTTHSWNEGTVTKKPTFSKGEKLFECTVEGCGETKTEEIAANASANYAQEFSATDYADGPWGFHGIDYDWDADNIRNAFGVDGVVDDYLVRKDGETVKCELKSNEIMADWMCAVSYTVTDAMKMGVRLVLDGGADVGIDVRISIIGADGTRRTAKAEYFGMNVGSALEINKEYDLQAGDTIYFIFSDKGEASSHKSGFALDLTRKEQV